MLFRPSKRRKDPLQMKVEKKGLSQTYFVDLYHYVRAISWFEFFLLTTSLYVGMNVFFAGLYFFGGENIVNADPNSFWDAFRFSFQTSTTIGYGHFRPSNTYSDLIVIFDTLSGIIFVAITTGLAFAKFVRPTARVLFSNQCVVHPYEGQKTLCFRVANARESHIANATIEATIVVSHQSPEGLKMQRIYDLPLRRSRSPVFFLSWLVMHTIDAESPLYPFFFGDRKADPFRIIISLTGIDDWSAQAVHTNHVYRRTDVLEEHVFADIIESRDDDSIVM
ncbi:MAG: ion channel, partial [Pseudomonadota bacterium]